MPYFGSTAGCVSSNAARLPPNRRPRRARRARPKSDHKLNGSPAITKDAATAALNVISISARLASGLSCSGVGDGIDIA
jgi:hypothetical protein